MTYFRKLLTQREVGDLINRTGEERYRWRSWYISLWGKRNRWEFFKVFHTSRAKLLDWRLYHDPQICRLSLLQWTSRRWWGNGEYYSQLSPSNSMSGKIKLPISTSVRGELLRKEYKDRAGWAISSAVSGGNACEILQLRCPCHKYSYWWIVCIKHSWSLDDEWIVSLLRAPIIDCYSVVFQSLSSTL